MFFTVATHNSAKNSRGFIHYDNVEFKDIPEMVMSGYAYAAGRFKDNHRKNDNWIGCEDVLILDIDNDCTINQAKKIFARDKFFIITTKSHNKDKNGEVCDRFRIFIELYETINDLTKRTSFIKTVMNIYPFVDKACKDAGRYYHASPADAEVYYNDGKPLKLFAKEIKIELQPKPPKQVDTILIPTDDIYRFSELSCQWVDKNGNTLDTGYSENELNVEAKFKGARIVLDNEFYSGNRANCMFKVACMLSNDGLDENTICDFLIRENDSRDGLRLNELMQNIKGSFRANR